MKKLVLIPAIVLCILSSCKKDVNTNTVTNKNCDKTVTAIAGEYSLVKLEISTVDGSFQDITNYWGACQLDDKLFLNTNGTSIYQDLGTSCSPSGSSTGTWGISSDGKMTI